jgi:uncharacterized protein (DUF1778 family)
MQKKLGRPAKKKADYRGSTISLRLTPDERRKLDAAVKRSGKSQSEWLRETLLNAAAQ